MRATKNVLVVAAFTVVAGVVVAAGVAVTVIAAAERAMQDSGEPLRRPAAKDKPRG